MERFKLDDPLMRRKTTNGIEGFIDENGCFICDSIKQRKDGRYYNISRIVNGKKKIMLLHRYVYETYNDCVIPENIIVRHMCDNVLCINPNHLELGTHQDNVDDMITRGRKAIGEDNGKSSLTVEDVFKIHELLLTKKYRQIEIAEMFGVSQPTISYIKSGELWNHL